MFDGNIAANGAALYNAGGIVLIETSTFANGYANNRGGAIYHTAGSLWAETSTFFSNIARNNGGAIYSFGTLDMENSTVSGNSASIGGGIDFSNSAGSMTLTNVTLHKNAASSTSGSNNGAALRNAGTATVHNTIFSGSTDGTDCVSSGTLTLEFSLVEDGSCNAAAGTGNQTGDPMLESLDDNGGTTHTHRLQTGSPAIGSGLNDSCPSEDQRGVTRSDPFCDMGACEELDTDGDGALDASDPDDDGDGIGDGLDSAPLTHRNLCSGENAELLDETVTNFQQCAAPVSVTIKGTTNVTATGHLEVVSPTTTVESGFGALGQFEVTSADPCPGCQPL